ncbi:MAG: WYL domain-containing protein [Vulcanimicrobiota bacterium]
MARDAASQMVRWQGILDLLRRDQLTTKREMMEVSQLSERQVERILKTIEGLGYPIYHERGRGYRVVANGHSLPIRLSGEEAWALLLLQRCSLRGLGEGAQAALANLFQKIRTKIAPPTQSTVQQLEPWAASDGPLDGVGVEVWRVLTEGLTRSLQIHFDYRKISNAEPMIRKVDPWGLFSVSGGWYLQAWDHDRNQVRNFRLSRIEKVRLTSIRATRPDGYQVRDHLFHRFDIGSGDGHQLELECDELLRNWLAENPLHPSQQLTLRGVSVRICNLELFLDQMLALPGLRRLHPPEVHQMLMDRLEQRTRHLSGEIS